VLFTGGGGGLRNGVFGRFTGGGGGGGRVIAGSGADTAVGAAAGGGVAAELGFALLTELTTVPPGIVMTCSPEKYWTVPHGCPIGPSLTVTVCDAVNSPDVTDTVVVPGLNAQNRPDDEDGIGFPLASSFG
jgi:hypothetical protein